MSRLYDALKNAQASLPSTATVAPLAVRPLAEDAATLRLAQAIDTRLADRPRRIVQVIGCSGTEDAGSVARRLARLSAVALRRDVLLLDPTSTPPVDAKAQAGHPAVADLPAMPAQAPAKPMRTEQDLPYRATTLSEALGTANLDVKGLRATWQRLRASYDLVVLDSPPVGTALGLALAPTVDGVVLVIEAEKTRVAQAVAARDALIGGGANVLGVVLDKRRYWVPARLWSWL